MALPASGPISLAQVRTELGLSGPISLGQSQVRSLAGVASGPISLSNLHGKSAALPSLTVNKSSNASGSDETSSPGGATTVNTNTVTCTASGGSGSYTYAWTYVSGEAATVLSPSSNATYFRRVKSAPLIDGTANNYSGTYRCTATDTVTGATGYVDVTVATAHYYNSGL